MDPKGHITVYDKIVHVLKDTSKVRSSVKVPENNFCRLTDFENNYLGDGSLSFVLRALNRKIRIFQNGRELNCRH